MTTAELAALLAGIDLNTARRRHRYARPDTPLQNSENFAPTN
jgi:transposase